MSKVIRTNNIKLRFLDSLRRSGIKKNSVSWQDYEKAKKLIPAGIIREEEYMKYVRWITEYINI